MSTRLIHIAPELPPTVGGVADYTAILSRRLVEVSDGAVEPVLVHAGKEPAEDIGVEFPVVDLSGQCSATALAETIQRLNHQADGQAIVLLEYSGYGYSKRGAPLWLARGLRRACSDSGPLLVTMFHELYATGPPWTSAFWFSCAQAYVAERLAQLSRAVMTNRSESADWLRTFLSKDTPIYFQPVFSNVGEPDAVPEFEQRNSYAVIFGGRNMKERFYSVLHKPLLRELHFVGVDKIVEVGVKSESPEILEGIPIERHGIQPAPIISDILLGARVSLLHYPVNCLTKSGIWGSYASHGVPSLIVDGSKSGGVVKEGVHYIRTAGEKVGDALSQTILSSVGEEAREWYRKNASSVIAARRMIDLIDKNG